MKTRKITDLEYLSAVSESANVLIEENGIAKRMPAGAIGKVKTVNGAEPDENGNITIELREMPEIPECKVQTVNGVAPDEAGNVEIEIPEIPEPTWESLPDKPFGETEKKILVSETEIERTSVPYENFDDGAIGECTVIFDGEECCGTISSEMDDFSYETYYHISFALSDGTTYMLVTGGVDNALDAPHTVEIYTGGETKTLDPKFLPEHEHEVSWESLPDKPFYTERISLLTADNMLDMHAVGANRNDHRIFVLCDGMMIEAESVDVRYGENQYATITFIGPYDPFPEYVIDSREPLPDGVTEVFYEEIQTIPYEYIPYIGAEKLPKAEAIADVTEAPTAEQFNALLAALRNAGYMNT